MLVCVPAACSARLIGELDEQEANRVVAALEQEGIHARKVKEKRGRDITWVINVREEDSADARRALQEANLPKARREGLARLAESGGIIPTAEEQRIRKAAAISEELTGTIESFHGVLEAKVLISLPEPQAFSGLEEEDRPESTASVLVRFREEKSFNVEDIQRLVSGAVAGMKPANVTVVLNDEGGKPKRGKAAAYSRIGPFLVAPGSKGMLLGFIIVLLGSNLLLAAIVVAGAYRFMKRRKKGAAE
ncbi:MAG: hypothetical protein ABIJ56_20110 [Pseudomonadota bacterium]